MGPQHYEPGALAVCVPLSIHSFFLPDCFSARLRDEYMLQNQIYNTALEKVMNKLIEIVIEKTVKYVLDQEWKQFGLYSSLEL